MKAKNDWHLLTDSEALEKLSVDMYKGLDEREVRKRRRRYGRNSIWKTSGLRTSPGMIASVFDIATLLLVISAVCAAMFDKNYEAGWLTAILVTAAVIRAVTFIRAETILEGTAKAKIPSVSVIRGGRVRMISADDIVPGDIVFLEAGDTVPCDGRVLSDSSAAVTEKGITENKTPLKKFNSVIKLAEGSHDVPCEFRSNMLFAGSTVLSGRMRMLAAATGEETLVSMKQGGIEIESAEIPEIEKLRDRSRTTSLVMLGCVMALTFVSMFWQKNLSLPEVFLSSMAMATAAMSEFLTVIGYIIFSVAIRDCSDVSCRLGRKKNSTRATVRRPEKLGGIGAAKKIVFCGSSFFKSGEAVLSACRAGGKYYEDKAVGEDKDVERLLDYAACAALGMQNGLSSGGDVKSMTSPERLVHLATDAYVKLCGKNIQTECALADHRGHEAEGSMGLETSLVLIENELYAVSCGNIDDVMRCCTMIETENGTAELDNETKKKIFTECARHEISGGRVLAVSRRPSQFPSLVRLPVLTQYMTFVGYFVISEKEEEYVRENIAFLKQNGITPVLFTRNSQADYYYLRKLGLFDKSAEVSSYTEADENSSVVSFDGLSEHEYAASSAYAMKNIGGDNVIAVGKSVWNSGVLSESEYGITVASSSMKNIPETLARNSDAAVYTDSVNSAGGLDGVVRVLKTSKRALGNISSAEFYLTVSQAARVVLMTASVCFGVGVMSPVFILIWGLLFDFTAVLVMAFGDKSAVGKSAVGKRGNTVKSAAFGAVWGAVLSLVSFGVSAVTKSAAESASVLAGAVILSGLALTELVMKPKLKLSSYNNADVLFVLFSAALASLLMLTEFGARLCSGSAAGICALFSLVPAAVLTAVCFIIKAVRKHKNK